MVQIKVRIVSFASGFWEDMLYLLAFLSNPIRVVWALIAGGAASGRRDTFWRHSQVCVQIVSGRTTNLTR